MYTLQVHPPTGNILIRRLVCFLALVLAVLFSVQAQAQEQENAVEASALKPVTQKALAQGHG